MVYTVYCSGSIIKGSSDNNKLCWTDTERNALANAAIPFKILFLNPDDPVSDLSNTTALFGRDMYQIQFADFIVVDARERRGIGIGIEIIASRILQTPLIIVAPSNTYYRMDKLEYRGSIVNDYVHPHLKSLADVIVNNFEEAGGWIKHYIDKPIKVKSPNTILEAIKIYSDVMLPTDMPMLELIALKKMKNNRREKNAKFHD